jgi:HlyD family type I secretion membrane fusion protein
MIARFLRPRPLSDALANQAINDFQSETAEITGEPDSVTARLVIYTLAGMVLTAILLANVIKLERIVNGNGRVISDAASLQVQPLETSIVRSIQVHEGQLVHKGDTLATLDPTFSNADVGNLRAQSTRLIAEIARLEAEQIDQPFHAEGNNSNNILQQSIWNARQAEYTSKMLGFKQKMERGEATIARAKADVAHYETRLGMVKEVEGMRRELERLQAGSRLNTLLASDSREEIARTLAQAQSDIQTASHEMEAQRADREVFVQQWKSGIARELVDKRSEFDKIEDELAKAEKRQDLVSLRAVDEAVVLEVGHVSVGSVLQAGEKLMTLVPADRGLSIETDVSAADQGFVAPGQTVNLKFSAYRYVDHGVGHGIVKTISADSFAPNEGKAETPNRFYRAHIDVIDLPLRNVPADFTLVPGMTVTTDIVVGKRTIMAYLLEGAIRTMSEGMREPG